MFKPMLAKDADLESLTFPLIAQPKLDGIRCAIVNGVPKTRTLKDVPNREIREALSDPRLEGLDGELIVGDPTADDAYRRTTSFVMAPNKTGEPWAFHVFDKWDHGGPVEARLDAAMYVVSGIHWSPLPVRVVKSFVAHGLSSLEAYEAAAIENGHEGVILRTLGSAYKFGRSGKTGPLLKLKRFIDFEAVILDVYEELHNANEKTTNELGRGQRSSHKANKHGKGTLGGFVVRAINGPAEGVEFRVGTGFNADQRQFLWDCSAALPGSVAKIKSFPIGVKDKPRHPVFLGFRDMEADGDV